MPKNKSPEWRLISWTGGGVTELLAAVSREVGLPSSEGFGEAVNRLTLELEQLRAASQGQATATAENTSAVIQNTVAQTTGPASAASSAGSAARSMFGSGLVLSPLITGLLRLFRRGQSEAPPPAPVVYTRPPSIHFEGAIARVASRDQASAEQAGEPQPGASVAWAERTRLVNVAVQVQAMDSRSFLDHSDEIARAVREAMLNSHALNDIVSEL